MVDLILSKEKIADDVRDYLSKKEKIIAYYMDRPDEWIYDLESLINDIKMNLEKLDDHIYHVTYTGRTRSDNYEWYHEKEDCFILYKNEVKAIFVVQCFATIFKDEDDFSIYSYSMETYGWVDGLIRIHKDTLQFDVRDCGFTPDCKIPQEYYDYFFTNINESEKKRMKNNARETRKQIFLDTKNLYETNDTLKLATKNSIAKQKVILESDLLENSSIKKQYETPVKVVVSKKRTLEAAKNYADYKVCVHNFASATNPGGGVENGSSAQEEAICRCSTLFPCISTPEMRAAFYDNHRNRLRNGELNAFYNDDCIYTPDVVVFKKDIDNPTVMSEDEWYNVDVITCAAPNLRNRRSNEMNPDSGNKVAVIKPNDLLKLHMKRVRRILDIAKIMVQRW